MRGPGELRHLRPPSSRQRGRLGQGPCRSPRGSCWRYESLGTALEALSYTRMLPPPQLLRQEACGLAGLMGHSDQDWTGSGETGFRGSSEGALPSRAPRSHPLLPSPPSLCPSELPRGLPRPLSPLPSVLELDPALSSTRGHRVASGPFAHDTHFLDMISRVLTGSHPLFIWSMWPHSGLAR